MKKENGKNNRKYFFNYRQTRRNMTQFSIYIHLSFFKNNHILIPGEWEEKKRPAIKTMGG